jgi:amidase
MQLSDYAAYDGLGLAALIKERKATPRELGLSVLAGIAAVNPKLNAVIEVYADAVDRLSDAPGPAPFYGLPTLTKDYPIEAGRPGEFGSIFAKGFRADFDHAFWKKLKAGGIANIGRTTTSEFGIAAATESSLYGSTRNPWDVTRGVAGSSGGAAAVVAAGIVPFAQGADGGGSIRVPSSYCGTVGLKPSRGRISGAPEANAPLLGLATSFVLTRSIRDTAALLDLGSGPVAGDGYEIPPPGTSYSQAIATPPSGLRIALCTQSWSGHPIDPEVKAAALATGQRLEHLGQRVEEASPEFHYQNYLDAQKVIWAAFVAQSLDELGEALGREVEKSRLQTATLALYHYGKALSATALIKALAAYDQITRKIGEFLATYDVLVTPTCLITPERVGTYDPGRPGHTIDTVFADLAPKETFTAMFNATGYPAISLPLHQSAGGLPIGIQFAAAFGREDLLLRLAAVLEAEYQWHRRKPPIHIVA